MCLCFVCAMELFHRYLERWFHHGWCCCCYRRRRLQHNTRTKHTHTKINKTINQRSTNMQPRISLPTRYTYTLRTESIEVFLPFLANVTDPSNWPTTPRFNRSWEEITSLSLIDAAARSMQASKQHSLFESSCVYERSFQILINSFRYVFLSQITTWLFKNTSTNDHIIIIFSHIISLCCIHIYILLKQNF